MNSFDTIRIRGARENNLRNISLDIPKYKITIFTGVSGSGKSSLVMDTIAAKSRRELNDTFPTFVQQYLPKYGRPKVDSIEGLPIAIVIDQKKPAQNSRSTVGTYTDIYALLRLLFSRVGKPFVGYSDSFSFNHSTRASTTRTPSTTSPSARAAGAGSATRTAACSTSTRRSRTTRPKNWTSSSTARRSASKTRLRTGPRPPSTKA